MSELILVREPFRRSKSFRYVLAWVAMVGLSEVAPAVAHHSYAEFDMSKTMEVTGVAKVWEWTNPHCSLTLVAADGSGKQVEFEFEGNSPVIYRRAGFPRDIIKVGQNVTITYHPRRDGNPGGKLEKVNGRSTGFGAGAPPPSPVAPPAGQPPK